MDHSISLEATFDRDLTDKEVMYLIAKFRELLVDKAPHRVNIKNEFWMQSTRRQ